MIRSLFFTRMFPAGNLKCTTVYCRSDSRFGSFTVVDLLGGSRRADTGELVFVERKAVK